MPDSNTTILSVLPSVRCLQEQGIIFKIRIHDGCILWHTLDYNSIKTLERCKLLLQELNNDKSKLKLAISRSELDYPNDSHQIKSRYGMRKIITSMNFVYNRLCDQLNFLKDDGISNKYRKILNNFKNIVEKNIDPELYTKWMEEAKLETDRQIKNDKAGRKITANLKESAVDV